MEEVEQVMLLDLHVGKPITRGALSVFPIWNGAAVASPGYDLTDFLSVAERSGSPVVGQLVLTNTGDRPALLLEGELLEGGQQHRVAGRSILVDQGQSEVLPVRCVEQGRWSGSRQHARGGRRAPVSVRAAEGQGQTWEQVGRFETRYGASTTSSLLDATHDAGAAAAALVAGIRPLPFQAGVLLCLAGQPVQLEVFDAPETLAAGWDALLHAAALDALGLPEVATPGRRARRFLARATCVSLTGAPAGLGTAVEGRTQYARVTGLVWQGRAVHAVAVNPRHELVAA
jgi:hypothetical protein